MRWTEAARSSKVISTVPLGWRGRKPSARTGSRFAWVFAAGDAQSGLLARGASRYCRKFSYASRNQHRKADATGTDRNVGRREDVLDKEVGGEGGAGHFLR